MRALLVEDDTTIAKSINIVLASESFDCDAMELGEDGIEIAWLWDTDTIIVNLCQR